MSSSTSTAAAVVGGGGGVCDTAKPRILCLHGKYQSGATFSNKIAGARRKLARVYDLEFLDGPLRLNDHDMKEEPSFAWWQKEDDGRHVLVQEGLEHVLYHIQSQAWPYQAVIGFSQGGVLATALASAGLVPSLKAIVTAGSPMVPEAFEVAHQLGKGSSAADANAQAGYNLPKLHLAGETDAMIPLESTRLLCERGGNGRLLVHDQGHLFPTRAARVQEILDFLEQRVLQTVPGSDVDVQAT
jgi:predicted esterase